MICIKGKSRSIETKTKISRALKGKQQYKMTDEIKEKIRSTLTGRKLSEEHKKNIRKGMESVDFTGSNNPNWKGYGGIDSYKRRRNLILQKMGNKCTICGETTKCCLELHHKEGSGMSYKTGEITSSHTHYKDWLINGIPKYIMLVCANCHEKIHGGILMEENIGGE